MRRIACDVGGTFTDLLVSDEGGWRLFKASTTPDEPSSGVLGAVDLAAADHGLDRRDFLRTVDTFVLATTRAINAILTGTTARTAFLTTRGHRDILLLREGGRLNPYDNTQEFPRPYIPRSLTFEIDERISAAGEIVKEMADAEVVEVAAKLRASGVEAVGVCLLWSIANSTHELRIGKLLREHLPGVPVTLSHQLNPIVREYRRASSACIDASLKPLMSTYLASFATRLTESGFSGRLLIVTSQGGVIAAEEAVAAPIHVLNSGPSMAPVAGRLVAATDADALDAIVADTGGTSFDVSLVRAGRIPWTSEAWIGPRFTGHLIGFPSVDVRSIGAGGGSIVHLDAGHLLHVGPQSAGADPGPACYGRGGVAPTVTDCALITGLLDPATFLGGAVEIHRDRAIRSLEPVARTLGVEVEQAALSAIDVLTQNMLGAVEEVTVKQGIDPRKAVFVAGGGAGGFNGAEMGRRLGCVATLFPEAGAALSAYGASVSDLVFSDARIAYSRSNVQSGNNVVRLLDELLETARSFIAASATGNGSIEFWVEARYPQQTWEIEVPFQWPSAARTVDYPALAAAFHESHRLLYAISDPSSPVEFITWRVRASVPVASEAATRRDLRSSPSRKTSARRLFLKGSGWTEVPLYALDDRILEEPVTGPAVIESSYTTIVVPTGSRARKHPSGSIEVTS